MCNYLVKIVEVSTAGLGKRGRILLKRGRYKLELVAKDHVLPLFHLEILLHVLTDHFDLAVWSLFEVVDDQVRVVSRKVVEEDRDPETDQALQVALAVSRAKEVLCSEVVITDLRLSRIKFLERVAADVTLRRVIIFLVGTQAFIGLVVRC